MWRAGGPQAVSAPFPRLGPAQPVSPGAERTGCDTGCPRKCKYQTNEDPSLSVSLSQASVTSIYATFPASFFHFFFWTYHAARGILVPRPGIELVLPAVEAQNPNPWTTREVPPAGVDC